MALFADIANRTRKNSLMMARQTPQRSVISPADRAMLGSAARMQRAATAANDLRKRSAAAKNPKLQAKLNFIDRSDQAMMNSAAVQQQRATQIIQQQKVDMMDQTAWMRYRNPRTAIMDLLTPAARQEMQNAGLQINLNEVGTTPSYNAPAPDILSAIIPNLNQTPQVNIPVQPGMTADAIRHELTHAGLNIAPQLFQNVSMSAQQAATSWNDYMARLGIGTKKNVLLSESAAITMGGAAAYPGFTPSNVPYDFREFFNINVPSWNYR